MKLKLNNNPKIGLGIFPGTPLEYIESTGTQYIDTGFKSTFDTKIEICFMITSVPSNWYGIVGVRKQTSSDITTSLALRGWNSSIGSSCLFYSSATGSGNIFSAMNKYKVIIDKNGCLINETTYTYGATPVRPSTENVNNVHIFRTNPLSDNSAVNARMKLYYCKIYDNETIVRDFIPCKDSNGVVCLYDTVSETFFYNSGTGNFIAGPETQVVEYTSVSDRFKLKCTDLFLKDCPNVNNIRLLKAILGTSGNTLSRIRINANNDVLTLSQAQQLLSMNGFNDSMQEQVKPRIVGSITINDYMEASVIGELRNTLDGCTITAPNVVDYDNYAVQTLDSTKPNYNPAVAIVLNNNGKGTVIANPVIEDGGRYFLTKVQAAAITSVGSWFQGKLSVTDSNNIAGGNTYTFNDFSQFEYFTGVTSIGGSAFQNCYNLAKFHFPQNISSIYQLAFANVGMDATNIEYIDLELPNLTSMGGNYNGQHFKNCKLLRSIVDLGHITDFSSSQTNSNFGSFCDCTNLVSAVLPDTLIVIRAGTFNGCINLETVELSEGLTKIDIQAFQNCYKLRSINLPTTITYLDAMVFLNAGRDATNIEYIDLELPNLSNMGSNYNGGHFKNCKLLRSIVDLGHITDFATSQTGENFGSFCDCTNLVSAILPSSLTSIRQATFKGCNNLEVVELPETISVINSWAFQNCYKLRSINLPTSITWIGRGAFIDAGRDATNIEYIDLTLPNLGSTGLSTEATYADNFRNCKLLRKITNLGNLTTIPGTNSNFGVFRQCNSLTEITLPSTLTNIGATAFYQSSNIVFMHLECETPPSIGGNAIAGTYKLYVGDGSSAEHDNEILTAYLNTSGWSAYSSRLDTWWNYLQSQQ